MIRWIDNLLESEICIRTFKKQNVAIIVDENIKKTYPRKLEYFAKQINAQLYCFPFGETLKTRETKEKLENLLLKQGYGSDVHLVAIGGGVTTDLVGFLAATYCRGVKVSFFPTTLMAMVDAALGGKNGVNVSEGKNLIGTIYSPEGIWCDAQFLGSLPQPQLRSGLAEMLKHGLIADSSYFKMLDFQSIDKKSIQKSQMIKLNLIAENEKDRMSRHLLNFGHTIAHALEKVSNYRILHGDAVALGIILESALSNAMGILPNDHYEEIVSCMKRFCFPLQFQMEGLYQAMCSDKKSKLKVPHFVLLEKIGQVYKQPSQILFPIDERLITTTLGKVQHDLCCH